MESSQLSIASPQRVMPPFIRFVLIFIIVSVFGTLGVMLYLHQHKKVWDAKQAEFSRAAVEEFFSRIDGKDRRIDIVVGAQTIGGDKKVVETTLICQRYGIVNDNEKAQALTPQVITIPGNTIVLLTETLRFSPTFRFESDDANYSQVVAGKTLQLLDRIHTEDPKYYGTVLSSRSEVPLSCQLNPSVGPSDFERELWHKIWGVAKDFTDNAVATPHGMQAQRVDTKPLTLKLDTVYQIWIDGTPDPIVHQVDSPKEISDMLQAMPKP